MLVSTSPFPAGATLSQLQATEGVMDVVVEGRTEVIERVRIDAPARFLRVQLEAEGRLALGEVQALGEPTVPLREERTARR